MQYNELIDGLIVAVNDLPKSLIMGEYVKFCGQVVAIVQQLAALKDSLGGDKDVSN